MGDEANRTPNERDVLGATARHEADHSNALSVDRKPNGGGPVSDDSAARVAELIRVARRGSEVSSRQLALALGVDDTPGQPATRRLIAEAVRRHAVPIGANERGYYLIESPEQLEEYVLELRSRSLAIDARAEAVTWAYGVRNPKDRPIPPLEAYE
jgi:hypothetical protein